MKRRFVIGIETLTPEQEEQLSEYLGKHGSWWHWISNLWLFVTEKEDIDCSAINDAIFETNAGATILVIEFPEDIDWSSRGRPNPKGRKLSHWLKDTWK